MTKEFENIIISLDVGSSKVVVTIGEMMPDGVVNVLGVGVSPSRGIEHGAVTDLEAVSQSIRYAIEEAESMSDSIGVGVVIASISGEYIFCLNESGPVTLDRKVSQADIDSAMHFANSVRLPDNTEIIHSIPQEFQIDRLYTKRPLGLSGNRLIAHTHLILGQQDWKRNLVNAIENVVIDKKSVEVLDIAFSGLASAYSVLKEEEKELGVCLVDIGAGTIDVVVYTDGAVRFSKVYKYAGNDVTNYLAQEFGISRKDAENIKLNYGSAISPPRNNPDKKFSLMGLAGGVPRIYTKSHVAAITANCYRQLLEMVAHDLRQLQDYWISQGVKHELIAGIVLTGGGSQIEDIVECAKGLFNAHVRVGSPQHIMGLTDYVNKPQYATALGLLQYRHFNSSESRNVIENIASNDFVQVCAKGIRKAKDWVTSMF